MRTLALALLAGALFASSIAAAAIDPTVLVVRQGDVPAGYRLERSESGVRTNAQQVEAAPEVGRLFRRWGRVTGYENVFKRGETTLAARADVFRSPRGAREMLGWAEREVRLSGIRGIRRANPRIGAESVLVEVGKPPVVVYVYWRQGVVWSALGGRGLKRTEALALARLQQRRILASLG